MLYLLSPDKQATIQFCEDMFKKLQKYPVDSVTEKWTTYKKHLESEECLIVIPENQVIPVKENADTTIMNAYLDLYIKNKTLPKQAKANMQALISINRGKKVRPIDILQGLFTGKSKIISQEQAIKLGFEIEP